MNYILISVLVIILAVSVVSKRTANDQSADSSPTPTESETDESSPTPDGELPVTIEPTPKSTQTTKPTVTPSPTQTPQNISGDWTYPGSLTDSTDTITDWYKNKIENMGYNVKSFVKTSANDVVKNVLSAAKEGDSITVEITKNPGESVARVVVSD